MFIKRHLLNQMKGMASAKPTSNNQKETSYERKKFILNEGEKN